MFDNRQILQEGTIIKMLSGGIYEITGSPIGFGGGSILYPAMRLLNTNNGLQRDGILYAIKECYPATFKFRYVRNSVGQIVPDTQQDYMKADDYLKLVKRMQLDECRVSQEIYKTGFRVLTAKESTGSAILMPPMGNEFAVKNVYTVIESMENKGQSLRSYVDSNGPISLIQTFHIIQKILFAVREIHQAGYLHLDLQDGNIFLCGALEDGSDFATIIDFGSARKLVNGKTCPIEDKALFATPGYSSPEIIHQNDGTLTLGPEADIYSVGCLMLLLLTGKKQNNNRFYHRSNSGFLSLFQLRSIQCPKHLTDRLQSIISHSLEIDLNNRYHSADEMLSDINAFMEALRPYKDETAFLLYDAFICYKHGTSDTLFAKKLQQHMEHFHAPVHLQSAYIKEKINRVFIDEGELACYSDFTQQIRQALKNSEWLIVICSPEAKESAWINREIEIFLEFHDRSRILTILASGSTLNSFPSALLQNGDDSTEPLAADIRGENIKSSLNKLKGDALLKIVAPILGTTFDSLKQRRKIYHLQRLAWFSCLFASLLLLFSIYAINRANYIERQADEITAQSVLIAEQANTISDELKQKLIIKSQYLAKEAASQMEAGDRFSAIKTALAAMPVFQDNILPVPEAELALSNAIGAYKSPYENDDSYSHNISPAGIFQINPKRPFFTDNIGKVLFAVEENDYHNGYQAEVWNTDTFLKLYSFPLKGEVCRFSPDDIINDIGCCIIATNTQLVCFDYLRGSVVWSIDLDNIRTASLSLDKKEVMVLMNNGIYFIDSATGDIISCHEETRIAGISTGAYLNLMLETRTFETIVVSKDHRWIAFTEYQAMPGDEIIEGVFLYNVVTKSIIECEIDSSFGKLDALYFTSEGNLITISDSAEKKIIMSDDRQIFQESIVTIICWDCVTGRPLWNTEFNSRVNTMQDINVSVGVFETLSGQNDKTDALLCTEGNICVLLSKENGSLLRTFDCPSHIVFAHPVQSGLWAITYDGQIMFASFETNAWECVQFISKSIATAYISGPDVYIRTLDTVGIKADFGILKFMENNYDINYKEIDLGYSIELTGDDGVPVYTDENYMIWYSETSKNLKVLSLSEEILQEFTLPCADTSKCQYKGVLRNSGKVYFLSSDLSENGAVCRRLIVYNIAEGKLDQEVTVSFSDIELNVLDILNYDDRVLILAQQRDNFLDGIAFYSDAVYLYEFNENCDEIKRVIDKPLFHNESFAKRYVHGTAAVSSSGEFLLFVTEYQTDGTEKEKMINVVNTTTGELSSVSVNRFLSSSNKRKHSTSSVLSSMYPVFRWDPFSDIVIANLGFDVFVLNSDCDEIFNLSTDADDSPIIDVACSKNREFVFLLRRVGTGLNIRNSLDVYMLPDKRLINSINLEEVSFYSNNVWEEIDKNRFLIIQPGQVAVTIFADTGRAGMSGIIKDCISYNNKTDSFLCYSRCKSGYKCGWFRRYTDKTLISHASLIIGQDFN